MNAPDRALQPRSHAALWGVYLACSWTWCIGMFLPALLIRDAGWMGYAVFFVPNVVGAGLMGFVLRSPEAAERIATGHAGMARAFSIVTLAFHVFWLSWVASFVRRVLPIPDEWAMGAGVLGVAFAISLGHAIRAGAAPRAAGVLWTLGAIVLGAVAFTPNAIGPSTASQITPAASPETALWLAPVCVFGFMLCPYLDLTFLLARRSVEGVRGGRVAFGLGFWLFFPCMIALTAVYAGPVIAALDGGTGTATPWAGAAILAHVLMQWVFTVRVHAERIVGPGLDRLDPEERGRALWSDPFGLSAVLVACVGAGLLGMSTQQLPAHAGLSGGEIVYRAFMGAYGLVFPCYVWSRMIPRRRTISHAGWIVASVLAMPCYWMGFVERDGVWLAPGVLIALVVPMLFRARPSGE